MQSLGLAANGSMPHCAISWPAEVVCSENVCLVLVQDLPDPALDVETRQAFDTAYQNIRAFHEAQQPAVLEVETMPGVRCRRVARPIGSVGLYVPGGTAVLPSSALMLAVPAAIAGCRMIVLATPPRPDGSITPEVLYCAKKAGVTHVLKAGGAQAVAALAWGTQTCPKVDKILGPGNQYVTAAKMLLQNSEAMVAIDMPAGPSEVLVIADAAANPTHVAIDLLSQVCGVAVPCFCYPVAPCLPSSMLVCCLPLWLLAGLQLTIIHSWLLVCSTSAGGARPRQPGSAGCAPWSGSGCHPAGGGAAVQPAATRRDDAAGAVSQLHRAGRQQRGGSRVLKQVSTSVVHDAPGRVFAT